MKKVIITSIAVILTIVCAYFGYMYYNGPKIIEGVVSESIDEHGKPAGISTAFYPDETVYFSAKANRFWIRKAEVVWYKGDVATANRFLVEDHITVNKAGYFTTKLSVPDALEEGTYSVGIFVSGKKIMETLTKFELKR